VHVGIVGGTGPLGRALAVRLAASGHAVVIGSRDAERAAAAASTLGRTWPGRQLDVSGGANEQAAACELVVLATVWDATLPSAMDLAPYLAGKTVVSVANALVRQGREIHALVPPRGSIAAAVQAAVPDAWVSAACQHLPASTMADLDAELDADVLVCADRPEAMATTVSLLGTVAGLRPLEAGTLASAGAVEAFTAVLVNLNIRYKAHSTLRLSGLDQR